MSTSSMTEGDVELATLAMTAFQQGDYEAAAKCFSELSMQKPGLWDCRLYLGMAYFRLSKMSHAMRELNDIVEWCPDVSIRQKAMVAMRAINKWQSEKSSMSSGR